MRLVLGALVVLMLLAVPAPAADLGGPTITEGPTGPLGPRWHRSGPYVGLAVGYDAQQLKADDFKFGDGGLIGGAFIGWNLNTGHGLVLGIEADYLLTGITSTNSTGGVTVRATNHFLASTRLRAGVPVGPALMYVTGGPAFTEKKAAILSGPFVSDTKDLLVGAAFGAGIEAELTRTLFVRLEALHYVFPDKDVIGPAGMFTSRDQQTTVRVGLGFKLN